MTTKTRKAKQKWGKPNGDTQAARTEYYRLVRERGNALMDMANAEGRGEVETVGELGKLVADLHERITELVKEARIGL